MSEEAKLDKLAKLPYPKFSKLKDQAEQTLTCPFYGCMKPCINGSVLKSHISRQHKPIHDSGYFTVDSNTGEIKIEPSILDYVLR